jgi:lysophospholipase L1-like esterase
MPLGDSITFGNGSSDGAGYRSKLYARLRADRKRVTFVGTHRDGPAFVDGVAFPAQHESHPGCTIGGGSVLGISDLVAFWLRLHPADVVLIMVGTNDLNVGNDSDTAPMRMGRLLETISSEASTAQLFVAQLIPSRDARLNAHIEEFNAALAALVDQRRRAGCAITLVDMYSAFVAHPAWREVALVDRLHPSDVGHALIADAWYQALAPRLA